MNLREAIQDVTDQYDYCNLVLYDYDNNIQERLNHCYVFEDSIFFDPVKIGSGLKVNRYELVDFEDYRLINITNFPKSTFIFYSHII